MPQSRNWPFKRLMVDHIFHGTTRVWWELDQHFNFPSPNTYQLQAGYSSHNDGLDWVDIGDPAIDAAFLTDDTVREHASHRILTHYRVVVTTADGVKFVSNPQSCWGVLSSKDWNLAREIVRKEQLRHDQVSQDGYLLRRMRYGVRNTATTDPLTGEVIDSDDLSGFGTAYKVGYHPPVSYAVDVSQQSIQELRGGADIATHSSRPTQVKMRVIAFPDIAKEDVWVDADTDQRWFLHDINVAVAWRGVPLVYDVTARLIAHSDVIYKIPVSPESYDLTDVISYQPTTGTGCVRVDHDYGEDNAYAYLTGECCGIEGATILAFTKTDWDGGARTEQYAVATAQTVANGLWGWAMMLDPGEYVLLFEKPGEYGPDHVALTVAVPDPGPPPTPDLSSSVSSSFGAF